MDFSKRKNARIKDKNVGVIVRGLWFIDFGKNTKTKDVVIGWMRLPRKLKLARNDKDKDVGGRSFDIFSISLFIGW